MGDTSIRVSEEAKRRLDLYKREGESYEDVILRLTEGNTWAGFGVLGETDTDTRAGMEQLREEMRAGMADDIEKTEER
ncbi:MAG: putative CopG family antitoxin [Halobacteriales archaeon]|jgi:predicted CopG family antitoxin